MHSRFALEIAVGLIALDGYQTGFDTRFIGFFIGDDFKAIAVVLSIALIHPEQHLRPVLRFRTSGSRMDLQMRIGMIIVI